MRSPYVVTLPLLLIASLATADDEATKPPPMIPEALLQEAQAAYEARDPELLARLARRGEPDAWLVADGLCLAGDFDAALAYARAAPRQDTARLPAYVESRRKRPADVRLRLALRAAQDAPGTEQQVAALAELDQLAGQGDGFERALATWVRGKMLAELKRSKEATETLLAAGQAAERLGWLSMAAQAFRQSGRQAYSVLDHHGTLAAWSRLLRVQEGRGDAHGTAEALEYVAAVHAELGDYARALQFFYRAEAAFTAIGDLAGTAGVLRNTGYIHAQRGDYHHAQHAVERGIALARETGDLQSVAELESVLGAVHMLLLDWDRALELYRRALAVFLEGGNENGVTECRANMGLILSRQGEFDAALEQLGQALRHYRKRNDAQYICTSLMGIGGVRLMKGELAAARTALQEAIALARLIEDEFREAYTLCDLAEVHRRSDELARAEQCLEQSLAIATRLGSDRLLMRAYSELVEVRMAQKQHERAVRASERALEHALSLVTGHSHDQAMVARDALVKLHKSAIRAARLWNNPSALFWAMESARVGALLEALENREDIRDAGVPQPLLERERQAKKDRQAAAAAYQGALADGNLRETRRRKRDLEAASEALQSAIEQIQREAKASVRLLYPQVAVLEELQAELRRGEAYLMYSLLTDPPCALVVTDRTTRTVSLDPKASQLELAIGALSDPSSETSQTVAQLRRWLLEPLGLSESVRHLLVSPDGVLGYVPFAALAEGRDVVFVPSATTMQLLKSEAPEPGQGVLALGDPDYRWQEVPGAEPTIVERGGMRLVPLPASRAEAVAVGDRVLLGKDATPEGFFRALRSQPRWHAVHLACHGLVDSERPMRSALALSFPPDGVNLLTCAEVYRMEMPTDLTVLSACETGVGKVHRTEGIVGWTQAFMLAGSRRVLVSLWKVNDEATQALMVKFYELWNPQTGPGSPERSERIEGAERGRLGAAAALRQAQEYVKSHDKWAHPYYWAAWVLWGLP